MNFKNQMSCHYYKFLENIHGVSGMEVYLWKPIV